MADEIKEKLVLKPGVVSTFLTNFSRTADNECLQFVDLIMTDKMVDAVNAKSMEEAKDVQIMDQLERIATTDQDGVSILDDFGRVVGPMYALHHVIRQASSDHGLILVVRKSNRGKGDEGDPV